MLPNGKMLSQLEPSWAITINAFLLKDGETKAETKDANVLHLSVCVYLDETNTQYLKLYFALLVDFKLSSFNMK